MTSPQTPWYRQVAAIIPMHIYLKSIGTTLFISLFFGAYFYLLKTPAYPTTVMPIILLDRLIGFYFWPTAVPAAHIDWAQYPGVDFLKSMDASGNACPSLHVATAVFSGIWLHHLLRRFGAPLWILLFNGVWCIGIVYSTVATRQHVAVDVLAGLMLGVLGAYLSLRHRVGQSGLIGVPLTTNLEYSSAENIRQNSRINCGD